jgi:hypothetical protein
MIIIRDIVSVKLASQDQFLIIIQKSLLGEVAGNYLTGEVLNIDR